MNHCHTSAQERAYSEHQGKLDKQDAAIEAAALEVFDSIGAALIDAAQNSKGSNWGSRYQVITLDAACAAAFHEIFDDPDGLTLNKAIDRVVKKSLASGDEL
ncbi:hypothetical protein [Kistimonas asteriae]|uniref:hypothetical protein n=1 Tax=Kistimonas asteriae TaxID=517724 RepID=UPI001BAC2D69|nr:hypothetical protein [Kistimonas asteriae]